MKNRRIILIIILVVLLLPVGITFSRFITENVKNYIMQANNFFFNSDKLVEGGKNYYINNWGGSGNFYVQFSLNNNKNNLLTSDSDITYDLSVSCDEDITCSLDSTSGIIYKAEKTDNFELSIVPNRIFNTGEEIEITVSATSSSPYVKTLSATFIITVGRLGITYEISDSVNSPYLIFRITNASNTYVVREAFGSYSVNDVLSITDYLALSDANKSKCSSVQVTLSFDPEEIVVDNTSNIVSTSTKTFEEVDNVSYINSLNFGVDAVSSTEIRFYKKDVSKNYTYPIVNSTSVISFSAS